MEKADIGLIGLGVMGQNLALNLAGKGWKVACLLYTSDAADDYACV